MATGCESDRADQYKQWEFPGLPAEPYRLQFLRTNYSQAAVRSMAKERISLIIEKNPQLREDYVLQMQSKKIREVVIPLLAANISFTFSLIRQGVTEPNVLDGISNFLKETLEALPSIVDEEIAAAI